MVGVIKKIKMGRDWFGRICVVLFCVSWVFRTIFLISVLCFCSKVVTLRKDYVLVGTSLRRITLTGNVVRDPHGHGEFSKTRLTNFRLDKRAIL